MISGTAAIPLLLVKLWTVFPKLLTRPPRELRQLVLHGLERASIAVLVAAGIFQLASGLANSSQWYPWGFAFIQTHYAMAWVADRRARRTHRGEAADRAHGARGRRGLRRTRPADHGEGGRSADPARTAANHVGGHRRGRARHRRRDGAGAAPRLGVRGPVRRWSTGRADQPVGQGCRRRRGRTRVRTTASPWGTTGERYC